MTQKMKTVMPEENVNEDWPDIPEGEEKTYEETLFWMPADFAATDARYVRFRIDRGRFGGWTFIDEIIVR